jgi:hypothetical protein
VRARVDASSPGVDGTGGTISFDATGELQLLGPIDVSGGSDGAGDIDVTGAATVTVATAATLNAAANNTGEGGTIDVEGATLVVQGDLSADGGNGQGSRGGSILLTACDLLIASTGRVSSLRSTGDNTLIGRDHTTIAGTLRADTVNGHNQARFNGPSHAPQIIAGASIQPPLATVQDPSVIPCAGIDTPTVTATITRTPTVTLTVPPGSTNTATPTQTADADDRGHVRHDAERHPDAHRDTAVLRRRLRRRTAWSRSQHIGGVNIAPRHQREQLPPPCGNGAAGDDRELIPGRPQRLDGC